MEREKEVEVEKYSWPWDHLDRSARVSGGQRGHGLDCLLSRKTKRRRQIETTHSRVEAARLYATGCEGS